MSQNSLVLPTTGTVSGLQMTQSVNNALDTLNTLASGASAPSSAEAGQFWHDTTNNLLKIRSMDNTTWISLFTLNESLYTAQSAGSAPMGQCFFGSTSSTVCTLTPFKGNKISFPGGNTCAVAASGITTTITSASVNGTAGQTLSVNTLYYAYLWNNSGTYTIDWSTTGYAVDSGSGINIKNGDATRVLIGMAYIGSGPTFVDSLMQRLVRSWFNDGGKICFNTYTTTHSTTSTTALEINTEIRCQVAIWAGETIEGLISGTAYNNTFNDGVTTSIAVDNTIQPGGSTALAYASGSADSPAYAQAIVTGASEGLHVIQLYGVVLNTGTANWLSVTALSVKTRR